jgi:hypothetical protein
MDQGSACTPGASALLIFPKYLSVELHLMPA